MHSGTARRLVVPHHARLHLQVEGLESRRLLTASQLAGSEGWLLDVLPQFPGWETEIIDSESSSDSVLRFDDPLPAIPFDDSVDPLKECPGVEPSLCLPGDADESGSVDFSDLLLLNMNFGKKDATWQDGDFDGDGLVSFGDFLLLASNFGQVA